MQAQRDIVQRVEEHLVRENKFHKSVESKRAINQTMRLLDEYNGLDSLANEEILRDFKYSELRAEIDIVARQLQNAQLNMDHLAVFSDSRMVQD